MSFPKFTCVLYFFCVKHLKIQKWFQILDFFIRFWGRKMYDVQCFGIFDSHFIILWAILKVVCPIKNDPLYCVNPNINMNLLKIDCFQLTPFQRSTKNPVKDQLREKCPNTELFLVRISLHSDWIVRDSKRYQIQENTDQKYNSVFWYFSLSDLIWNVLQ